MKEISKILFATSRPVSWVNTAYPFGVGYLLTGGSVDIVFWVGVVFFLIPYNLAMYGINDVFDYESDMRNPRKGGIEGAITPKKYHAAILSASWLLSLPFVAVLVAYSSLQATIVLFVVLFFVVAYSAKYLRFKEIPFLDSVTSSIHFVGPLVYALSLAQFPSATWPYVVAFFLWGCGSHAFGAVQDIIPDREAKIRSIATIIGARATVWFALACYGVAVLVVSMQGGYAPLAGLSGIAYVCNVLPFIRIRDETSGQARAGWKRFLWLNYLAGFIVTLAVLLTYVSS